MSQLFLFMGRRKKSKPDHKPEVEEEEPEPVVEVPSEPEDPGTDLGLDVRLSRARFPIKNRADLTKALGGSDSELSFGNKVYRIGEVVDRCFASRNIFHSPQEVAEALSETSWIKVIMGKLHMLPFPVSSKEQLAGRLRGTYIEGVPVMELLDDLDYPVGSPSDLLAQLARPGPTRTPAVPEGSADGSGRGDALEEPGEGEMELQGEPSSEEEEKPIDSAVHLVEETSA